MRELLLLGSQFYSLAISCSLSNSGLLCFSRLHEGESGKDQKIVNRIEMNLLLPKQASSGIMTQFLINTQEFSRSLTPHLPGLSLTG